VIPFAPTPIIAIDPYVYTPVNTTATSGTFNIQTLNFTLNLWDISLSSGSFVAGQAVSVCVFVLQGSISIVAVSDVITFIPTYD